tara:strand:+ start:3727 stop:4020 length:294 start_codon:yes stop_codon:yes gene_type:complete
MIGLGRTVEVGGVVYEVIRTIPIASLKEGITDDEIKELAKMYVAEKAFKSETKGEYFFVNEVEDIEWEDIIEKAVKPKKKKKDGKRNTGNTHSDSDS